MKQFITACILLLTAFTINAQGWQTKNLYHLNGYFQDHIDDSVVDSLGNKYMAGHYDYSSPDFDPGPDEVYLTEFEPGSFIVKLDSNNNFIWVKGFETLVEITLSMDKYSNIYFSGYRNAGWVAYSEFDCDPSSDTYLLNNTRAVTIKLNSGGEFIWGRNMPKYYGTPKTAVSDNGEVFYFNNLTIDSIDVDPSNAEYWIYNDYPNASKLPYIVKLDTDGNFEWVKTFNGPGGILLKDLKVDDLGNILLLGDYEVLIDFDPNAGTHELYSNEGLSAFLLKLTSDGGFVFVRELQGNTFNTGYISEIVIDKMGNYYNLSYHDIIIVQKTSPIGDSLWIDNSFLSYNNHNTFLFGGEFDNLHMLSRTNNYTGGNIIKWNENGNVISTTPLYKYPNHYSKWTMNGEFVGEELHIYGNTIVELDIYTTCDSISIPNLGNWDGFYHVLESCNLSDTMFICSTQPVQETYLTEYICQGDTSSTGESVSGNYVYNLFTAQYGCDSTVYLDLTVNEVPIDTINNQVIITDTTYNYVELNDTTYNYVEIQDTTFNNTVINDTTYNNIVLNDTSYNPIVVDIFINDTTYNNIVLNDTSYNTIIVDILLNDTTYNNLILIDTTYEFVEIYDTTFNDILIIDTMYTYVEVYDTTYNDIGLLEIDCTTFTSQEEITQQGIEVYPNPFTEAFYSSTTGKLYNIQGQYVMDVVDGLNFLNQTGHYC